MLIIDASDLILHKIHCYGEIVVFQWTAGMVLYGMSPPGYCIYHTTDIEYEQSGFLVSSMDFFLAELMDMIWEFRTVLGLL